MSGAVLRLDHLLTSLLATALVLAWLQGAALYLAEGRAAAALGAFLVPALGILHRCGLV